ncbi:MAG TPA: hypothetical protein VHS30_11955 [Streptosporangiaceae bacterium]|jgi:hypothetical protein|nr:hypothetical protein [Streptosporangiaceae bacterium]
MLPDDVVVDERRDDDAQVRLCLIEVLPQGPGLDEACRLVDGIARDALGVADHRARVQGHPELHAEGIAGRLVVLSQRGGQVAEGLGRHRGSRRIRGDHDQGPIAAILMEISPR